MASIRRLVSIALTTVLVLTHASYSTHVQKSSNPAVSLDNGLTIQGTVSSSTPNVAQFLGVPYAKSPLGSLRFAPPEPYSPVNGTILNGTVLPPSCMQYQTSLPSFAVWIPHFQIGSAGISEDCLTVSIWTPATTTGNESLPVLIWIYGGAFVTGGVDIEWQDPAQWVQRTQGHVVVALNYRLNIFGFPNSAALDQQNLGLLDQRLAIQWVQENIANFGGDPSRMVLWGQSAGGISVDLYNFAWASDPIVKGLIMHSGTAHIIDALASHDTTHSNFSFVAANVGCANQTGAEAELACMRKVPASAIENFLHSYTDAGTTPAIGFVPIRDNSVVFGNYTEKTLNDEISELPAIIGFNANEGVFLAPFSYTGVNQTLADSLAYEIFWCPPIKTTYERLSANRTTYRYFYNGNFTNISIRPWLGAYHGSELPQVFGTHSNFNSNSTPFEYSVSHAMQDAWLAFASDPINGLSSVGWPTYNSTKGQVRTYAVDGEVAQMQTLGTIEEECANLGLA